MLRLAVVAVVSLLVGAAASAAVVVSHGRASAEGIVPDSSVAGDSEGVAVADPESVADSARFDDVVAAYSDSSSVVPVADIVAEPDSAELWVIESDSAAVAADTMPASAGVIDPERMAKIFASMQPRDAARVLERMSNIEIEEVLGHLGNRQAAAILTNISAERAAAIGQAVLRGARSSL